MGADDYSAGKARRAAMALARATQPQAAPQGDSAWPELLGVDREPALLGAVVLRLLGSGGGWLRMVPDAEGVVWCKWRYTCGRWEGFYSLVRWVPTDSTLSEALEALERKVAGAWATVPTHKPTKDRY